MIDKNNKTGFNYDRYLLLNKKRAALILAVWLISVLLHNAVYALLNHYFPPAHDEPFFFFLAVVIIPLYALFSLIYTIIRKSMTNLPFKRK